MAVKLGEMLIKANLLTPKKLQEALEYQKTNGGKLGFNLVKLGFVKEEEITRVLSQQYGVPAINLSKIEVDDTVVKLIPSEVAQKYLIMPVSRTGTFCELSAFTRSCSSSRVAWSSTLSSSASSPLGGAGPAACLNRSSSLRTA